MSPVLHQLAFDASPDVLLIVDGAGRIVRVNQQVEGQFGYEVDELVGAEIEVLVPARLRERHAGHRSAYMREPKTRPMGASLELFARRKDGSEFPVDIMLSPLDPEGEVVLCVVRDITERKEAERLRRSLHEKEIRLKEIHHRVKNNLAVISSIFYLQSTTTRDEQTVRILKENQDRVRCMALVHESLYLSDDSTNIDFADYAANLCQMVLHSHPANGGAIELRTNLDPVRLNIETAVPCGMILNELVTNALTHAFPGGEGGEIVVGLREAELGCILSVSDTGVGLPEDLAVRETGSLGLRLIRSLAKQIDGVFEATRGDRGTVARLTFPVEQAT